LFQNPRKKSKINIFRFGAVIDEIANQWDWLHRGMFGIPLGPIKFEKSGLLTVIIPSMLFALFPTIKHRIVIGILFTAEKDRFMLPLIVLPSKNETSSSAK
jgi:hypothetical protein